MPAGENVIAFSSAAKFLGMPLYLMLVSETRAKYGKSRTNSFSKENLSYGLVVDSSLSEEER